MNMIIKNLIVTISEIDPVTKEKQETINLRTSNVGLLIVETVLPKVTVNIQDLKNAIMEIEAFVLAEKTILNEPEITYSLFETVYGDDESTNS